MNSKQFSLEIEKYRKEHPGTSYMDCIVGYCESRGIDTATVGPLVNKSLKEIGYNKSVNQLVYHQVKLAKKANLDAIVCSAHEVNFVKKFF